MNKLLNLDIQGEYQVAFADEWRKNYKAGPFDRWAF